MQGLVLINVSRRGIILHKKGNKDVSGVLSHSQTLATTFQYLIFMPGHLRMPVLMIE